jgi:hypothetical protein
VEHWAQLDQLLGDGLHRFGVQRGWRWAGQIGDDVVPQTRFITQR